MQHMNPRKIARFFKMLAEDGRDGAGRAMAMYNYVVTVEAKYLQMMCVNHTHKQDIEALSSQYELFISHHHQLTEAMSAILKLEEVSDLDHGDFVYHGVTKVMALIIEKKTDELKAMSMFLTGDALAQSSCRRRRKSEPGKILAHISAAWLAAEVGDTASLNLIAKFKVVNLNKPAVSDAGVHLSSLQVAAEQGHLETVELLLTLQPCVNSGKNCLLEPCRSLSSLYWSTFNRSSRSHTGPAPLRWLRFYWKPEKMPTCPAPILRLLSSSRKKEATRTLLHCCADTRPLYVGHFLSVK